MHRPGDADGPAAAAAVRAGHPQFLRPAPRQPVRLPGADAAGDRAVRRRHPALHRCAPAGAWSGSRRGQGKDQVAREYLAGHHGGECIVFAGVAREKNRVGRTAQRRDRATGKRYPWLCRPGAMAGHWHFYGFDADFGPFPSAGRKASPSRAWITRSARSAARRRPRRICDGLTGQKIYRFAGTWLARLPQPFTRAGQDAGYRWPLPAGQVEFSATMAPDRPVSGRIFSRAADPRQPRHRPPGQGDHRLRPGHRPARQVRPPGTFRTRVITTGTCPCLCLYDKKTLAGQYLKEGRALRTKTTINQPRDLGTGKELTNLAALATAGDTASGARSARPAQAPRPPDHRTHPAQPHLPGHRRRPVHRPVLHPADQTRPHPRTRRHRRHRPAARQPAPPSRPHLPDSHRRPHRPSLTRYPATTRHQAPLTPGTSRMPTSPAR